MKKTTSLSGSDESEESVDDFAMQLLRVMGYTGRALGRDLRGHRDVALFICGECRYAKTYVCVMDTYASPFRKTNDI